MSDPIPPADYRQALAEGWLPIREAALRTGVNPVTLRAWERRYGLVVPYRSPKGHRLYSPQQVERIAQVRTWLDRGVAVSKVRTLLDLPQEPAPTDTDASPWEQLRQQALDAIARLDERTLDEVFNGALAIYPAQTLCERLMLPLQAELQRRWQGQFGSWLERLCFHSWLRSKLGSRLYHHNRQHAGAPLLLVNQSEQALETGHWLCAWLASNSGCPVVVLDGPLPPGELALAEERLAPRGVLLYSNQTLNTAHLPRLLAGLNGPVVLAGASVSIHAQALESLVLEHPCLHLAPDAVQAYRHLQTLGLFTENPA
ncbi:MAG: HTH-type transcriptional repressor BluR [Stenotrophomonas maltophilia]|nr:MAG: HTH-type transcriptional repressor BluR [Stenotrophomonas maltophilia]